MLLTVTNAQREVPVNTAWMTRLSRRAIRRLGIRTPGTMAITFIGSRRMRALNKQFCRHDRTTDVLSFLLRRDQDMLEGEVIVSAETAVRAIRSGAYDYLHKPFEVDNIWVMVQRALEKRALGNCLDHLDWERPLAAGPGQQGTAANQEILDQNINAEMIRQQ